MCMYRLIKFWLVYGLLWIEKMSWKLSLILGFFLLKKGNNWMFQKDGQYLCDIYLHGLVKLESWGNTGKEWGIWKFRSPYWSDHPVQTNRSFWIRLQGMSTLKLYNQNYQNQHQCCFLGDLVTNIIFSSNKAHKISTWNHVIKSPYT